MTMYSNNVTGLITGKSDWWDKTKTSVESVCKTKVIFTVLKLNALFAQTSSKLCETL